MSDPLLRMLASLPQAQPDRERAARVKARCHAVLARGRQRPPSRGGDRRLTDGLLLCLGAAYLVEVIRLTLHLAGVV
jgi:hypothetical protein